MKDIAEIQSIAASLYDGGWRSDDKDGLIYEYNMPEDEAEKVCEWLAEFESGVSLVRGSGRA